MYRLDNVVAVFFLITVSVEKLPKYEQRGKRLLFCFHVKSDVISCYSGVSLLKKVGKGNLLRCFDTRTNLSRFVENVCKNVLLYLLKLFPFSYRNDFVTEKYVFFYIESIGKTVFVLSFCVKKFSVKTNAPKNVPRVRKRGF